VFDVKPDDESYDNDTDNILPYSCRFTHSVKLVENQNICFENEFEKCEK
jgi:hypothetical protein